MNNKPTVRRTSKKDDLTVIKGIREARQRVLRQALSVQTYDDLARTAVEDIVNALKAEGQSVARASVESWIAEAERLAATRSQQRANARRTETQSVALFFLEFLTPQALGDSPAYRTRIHYMERDRDEVIDGVDPILIWSRIGDALNEDAPHLAAALNASVEDYVAAHAGEALPPPQSQQAPAYAGSPPEKRLHDVLSEVERIVGSPVGAGTFHSAATLTPVPQTDLTPPPAAASATIMPAKADTPSEIEVSDERLQYYLHKYGTGVEASRVPEPPPQTRRAEPTVKASDDVEQIKLARYIEKYGRM